MKLYEDKNIVKSLECILAEHYPFLEYDAKESKRFSKGDSDALYVKVIDLEAPRARSDATDINNKLKNATEIEFFTGGFVNEGPQQDKWTHFLISRFNLGK